MTHAIFIDGEAGTTGLDVRRRLEGRPELELISLPEDRRKDAAARAEALNSADLVILCLPDSAAVQAVEMITNPAVKVIDASTAFRTAMGWTYGLPELDADQRAQIAVSRRVSNPGCYPTGFIALVRPLVGKVIPADWPVTCNAVSGYSGGGKGMIGEFEGKGPETPPVYRAYGLGLGHKHVPEMFVHAGLSRAPLFAPAVGSWRQGMLVEVPLHLGALPRPASVERVHAALAEAYAGEPFVEVVDLEASEVMAGIDPEGLNGTNRMRLHVFGDRGGAQARLVAQLDNLGKGASGAAVQNLNLMLGLEETAGL